VTDLAEPHIVLVGLMATGKTSIGRPLAAELGRELTDSDTWIESRTDRTVRELWEEGGEGAYRPLELQHLLEALDAAEPLVVAAAAGTILEEEARARLFGPTTYTAWLRADPAWLAAKAGDKDHRPLLGDDPLAVLTEMHEARKTLYQEVADVIVDVDGLADRGRDGAARILGAYRLR
jgi:shikimate kinase